MNIDMIFFSVLPPHPFGLDRADVCGFAGIDEGFWHLMSVRCDDQNGFYR
jgi:hypothetical protein